MSSRSFRRLLAPLLVAGFSLGACGGDGDSDGPLPNPGGSATGLRPVITIGAGAVSDSGAPMRAHIVVGMPQPAGFERNDSTITTLGPLRPQTD